jgi:chaperone LolA
MKKLLKSLLFIQFTMLLKSHSLSILPCLAADTKSLPRSSVATMPTILLEIEKKYQEADTLYAHFSQVNHNKILNQKKLSSGKIFIKHPAKIRWETEKPDPSVLISNGEQFWLYTPPFDEEEHGQLIEKKSSEIQSQVATALLSGNFSKMKSLKIRQKTSTTFLLTPKTGSAGTVKQALITINRSQKTIENIKLQHQGGNESDISLSEITLGAPLEDKLFIFKAPPNTDRVKD